MRQLTTPLVGLCCLCACQGSSIDVASTVARLASTDKTLATRSDGAHGWITDESGRIVSERPPKKLGKVSARLAQTADGEWEVALGAVHRVALGPVGARPAKVELDGKRAIYRDAYPSTDLEFTSSVEFAEQFLLLRDAQAPNSFAWDVRFPAAIRSARPSDFGALDFVDDREKAVLRMPRPIAIDSAGTRRDGSLEWDGKRIVVSVDTNGLVFPVLLDPVIETMGWVRVPLLGNRSAGPAMATLGSTIVLFGGDLLDERTWIFDGTTWTGKLVSPHPRARGYHAMATLGDKVVLFGGWDFATGAALDDTWEWDGTNWTRRYPATVPPARCLHAMTTFGDRIVMFGGGTIPGGVGVDETWEWDGDNWTLKTPAVSPGPSAGHVLAVVDSKVVLFGGDAGSQTWLWDGATWALVSPAVSPNPYYFFPEHRLASAAVDGVLMLHVPGDGTWQWDGSNWTELAGDDPKFYNFYLGAMATIGTRVVGVGGSSLDNSSFMVIGGTWDFEGTRWTQVVPPDSPPGCRVPLVATFKDQIIEVCEDYGYWFQGTWAWDGSTWKNIASGTGPDLMNGIAAGGDSVVGFYWFNNGLSNTWRFDGVAWTKENPPSSPTFYYWANICMAPLANQATLVADLGDVWRYDGTTWTVTHPPPDVLPASCDAMTDFGGQLLLVHGETYSFDGTRWSDLAPAPPTSSSHCSMVSLNETALLVCRSDVWEWDGSTWTERPLPYPLPVIFYTGAPGLASLNGEAVLLGGETGREFGTNNNDATWVYRSARAPGSDCTDSLQCFGEHCVNGLCCDAACDRPCEACDLAGHEGTCTPITGPPRDPLACPYTGICGGVCNGISGACTVPDSSVPCRAASCADGIATLPATCDGVGHCPDPKTQACAPYLCSGAICAGNCVVDSACESGFYCPAGICVPQSAQGIACTTSRECASGFCADGVCCDKGCIGRCEACDVQKGTCLPAVGAPHGSRKACISDGSVCSGACDGKNTSACTYPDSRTSCRNASCSNDVATVAATCDGAGGCPSPVTASCAPYHCAAKICAGNCTTDSDCAAGSYCPAGICRPKVALGVTCGSARECASGHCTDGVCCDSECTGQCEACDVPGEAGACRPVLGSPRGARPACGGSSLCAGFCDGISVTACEATTDLSCRPASCSFGVAIAAAKCDGTGTCPDAVSTPCEPFACAGDACATRCATANECAAGYTCSGSQCVKKSALGASCTTDSQCGSGHCVDALCCESSCDQQCMACDVTGSPGKCLAVEGSPHGIRTQCQSGSQCHGGACQPTAVPSSGCGCSSSAGAPFSLFAIALGALLYRRRRARR